MKKILFALFFLFCIQAGAQVDRTDSVPPVNIRDWIDSTIQHLDFSHISSGILMDKGLINLDPIEHQGLLTDSPTTFGRFMTLYNQVYYGRVNGSYDSLPHPDSLYLHWIRMNDGYKAAVSLLYTPYHRVALQGINDTPFFDLVDSMLYDNYNRVDSPYVVDTVFICAVQRSSFVSGKINFVFPSENLFNLSACSYTLEADFGSGWQSIMPDSIYPVLYIDSGSKSISVRIHPAGGRTFYSALVVNVEHGSWIVPQLIPDIAYTDPVWNDPENGTIEAGIYLANPGSGCMNKPVIFVEGFDYLDEFDLPELEDLLQEKGISNNFWSQLQNNGYDIIILNFHGHGGDDIRDNAEVLRRLIHWVNANKCGDEKLVVAGASMGGLIARYCLAKMENECDAHETRLYISFDSPHQGANIPLGLQCLTITGDQHLKGFFGIHEQAEQILCPAARQMLVSHVTNAGGPAIERTAFMLEYEQLGYPQLCRNVGIGLGNSYSMVPDPFQLSTTTFNPGDEIFEWIRNGVYKINTHVYAVPTSSASTICYFKMNIGKVFGIPWSFGPPILTTFSYQAPKPFDTRPGSYLTTQRKVKNEIGASIPGYTSLQTFNRNHHCMIHTNSAFNILSPYNSNDVMSVDPSWMILNRMTEFDNIGNSSNSYTYYHVIITPTIRNFALDEIKQSWSLSPPPTKHLFGSISNATYNFGGSLSHQNLNTVDIEADGIVQVNGNYASESGNGPIPSAGSTLLLDTKPCTYINIKADGKLIIGDDNTPTNNKSVTTFKTGSILDIKDDGILHIHDGSRLVIDDGALLIFNPGAIILLDGPNAVLEIKGRLVVKSGATFTFSQSPGNQGGYIKFVKTGTAGNKFIEAEGTTSKIDIQGADCRDKIIEIYNCSLIPEYSDITPSHYFSEIKLRDGLISYYNSAPSLTVGAPGILSGLELKAESGSTNSKGFITKGQSGLTISDVKFNGLLTGLLAEQDVYGNSISMDNCRFFDGDIGLQVNTEGFTISNTLFSKQGYYGILTNDADANSSLSRVIFSGDPINALDFGLSFEGSGGPALYVEECLFNEYYQGIYMTANGTQLTAMCSYFTDNQTAINSEDQTTINLSPDITINSKTGGNCTFDENGTAIQMVISALYLKNGNNAFISSNTTVPHFIYGFIPSTQSQLNTGTNPAQLDGTGNFWSPSLPGILNNNFYTIKYSSSPHPTDVIITGTMLSSQPDDCDDYSLITDICPTLSKKEGTMRLKQFTPSLQETTGVTGVTTAGKVSIYPNPAGNYISVRTSGEQVMTVSIYDLAGKLLIKYDAKDNDLNRLNTASLGTGVYIIEVITTSAISREKLSIVR